MSMILAAEDDPLTQKLIVKFLGDLDLATVCVDDGAQCLEALRSWQPDLLLLDIMMPVCDGIQVLEKVRSDPKLTSMAVVMLTARGDAKTVRRALELGADDFLIKPLRAKEMHTRIRLHTYRPSFDEVRALVANLHVRDTTILSQAGLRGIDAQRYTLYPLRDHGLPLCVRLPSDWSAADLAKRDDATLAAHVALYGRGVAWKQIWPRSVDVKAAEPLHTPLFSDDELAELVERFS